MLNRIIVLQIVEINIKKFQDHWFKDKLVLEIDKVLKELIVQKNM